MSKSGKDLNYIAALEKAIAKKYGQKTIINPKSNWDEEKEKEHIKQSEEFYKKQRKNREQCDKINKDGFFVGKHLINKKTERKCPVCDVYSFDMKDDVYMNKFECCYLCFIQYVEDREERWENGWRPDKEQD